MEIDFLKCDSMWLILSERHIWRKNGKCCCFTLAFAIQTFIFIVKGE